MEKTNLIDSTDLAKAITTQLAKGKAANVDVGQGITLRASLFDHEAVLVSILTTAAGHRLPLKEQRILHHFSGIELQTKDQAIENLASAAIAVAQRVIGGDLDTAEFERISMERIKASCLGPVQPE